ncbi:hypothetical protein CPT76_08495 [Paenibacillus sp. AR247]|nr:hypothetical protein CPT76_08495 [Paenibacillus sp. AR247]
MINSQDRIHMSIWVNKPKEAANVFIADGCDRNAFCTKKAIELIDLISLESDHRNSFSFHVYFSIG